MPPTPSTVSAHGFAHVFLPATPISPLADLTVLMLHGTGGDERDLLPLAARVAPGAAVLSVRGGVLEHGMPRFFRRLAEGVFDLEDLAQRTAQLGAFVDAAMTDYGRDRGRVVAIGFSNGANIAASMLLRQPDAFAAAALLRAMVPFEPENVAANVGQNVAADVASHVAPAAGRAAARVLIAAGRADPIVPPTHPERLAALLRAAGCSVEVRRAAAAHQLVGDDVAWTTGLVATVADGTAAGPTTAKRSR